MFVAGTRPDSFLLHSGVPTLTPKPRFSGPVPVLGTRVSLDGMVALFLVPVFWHCMGLIMRVCPVGLHLTNERGPSAWSELGKEALDDIPFDWEFFHLFLPQCQCSPE